MWMRLAACSVVGFAQAKNGSKTPALVRERFTGQESDCREAPEPTFLLRLPFQLLTFRPFSSKLPTIDGYSSEPENVSASIRGTGL